MAKILCIDDEVEITHSLEKILSLYGHEVYTSNSAVDGTLLAATIENLNLIILDVRLSDSNGIEVCEVLKKNIQTKNIPIIFLSALSSPEEKVIGLRKGACDYMAKPFNSDELAERINIAVDNIRTTNSSTNTSLGGFSLNASKRMFCINDEEVKLTKKEFDILHYLYSHQDKIISKTEIQRHVWKNISVGNRTLDTHVINIRKKIKESHIKIITKFGEGYLLQQ